MHHNKITSAYDFDPMYNAVEGGYSRRHTYAGFDPTKITPEKQRYYDVLERQRREWGVVAIGCFLAAALITAIAIVNPLADAIHDKLMGTTHTHLVCYDANGSIIPDSAGNAHFKECIGIAR